MPVGRPSGTDPRLDVFLRPRSVALVGASPRPGSYPGLLLDLLTRHGFPGPVYPVNPNHDRVGDRPCFPRLADVPGTVDLVLAMVPARATVEVAKEAAAAGARGLVAYASGFREAGGGGADAERELAEVAREHEVRVLGPNCQGFIAFPDVAASFTRALELNPGPPGHVAYVGQSGAIGGTVLSLARERGVGFRSWHSVGNQCDVSFTELALHLLGDDEVEVLALYVEQLGSLSAFRTMTRAAAAAGKRVVALRAGTSEAGRRAALSHTGAMVPSGREFELVAERDGVVVVEDIEEMVDALSVLAAPAVPSGRRVGIVSTSGGAGALAVDHLAAAGLAAAEFSDATRERLAGSVPPFGSVCNPVDVTAELFKGSVRAGGPLADVLATVADADEVDWLLVVVTMVVAERAEALADDIIATGRDTGRAVLVVWLAPPSSAPGAFEAFRRAGIPVFTRLSAAATTGARLLRSAERLAAPVPLAAAGAAGPVLRSLPAGRVLVGSDCGALLDELGIARPAARLVRSAAEAAAAVEVLGGPAVCKVQSADVAHKTDAGGVRVGVTAATAARTYDEIVASVRAAVPGAAIDGVVVEPLVDRGREFLVSAVRHGGPGGPMALSVGLGGVETELHRDLATEVLPVDGATVAAMLSRLRAAPLLAGYRGRPPLDADALADVALRVAAAAETAGPALAELEINPLLVGEAGRGAVALDALVRTYHTSEDGDRP